MIELVIKSKTLKRISKCRNLTLVKTKITDRNDFTFVYLIENPFSVERPNRKPNEGPLNLRGNYGTMLYPVWQYESHP